MAAFEEKSIAAHGWAATFQRRVTSDKSGDIRAWENVSERTLSAASGEPPIAAGMTRTRGGTDARRRSNAAGTSDGDSVKRVAPSRGSESGPAVPLTRIGLAPRCRVWYKPGLEDRT